MLSYLFEVLLQHRLEIYCTWSVEGRGNGRNALSSRQTKKKAAKENEQRERAYCLVAVSGIAQVALRLSDREGFRAL